jgi:hypothetical protein
VCPPGGRAFAALGLARPKDEPLVMLRTPGLKLIEVNSSEIGQPIFSPTPASSYPETNVKGLSAGSHTFLRK